MQSVFISNTVGDRLKEERFRVEINQSEFAALGGVSRNTQTAYEKGTSSPDAKYFQKIIPLTCDVQYIITGLRSDNINLLFINENEEVPVSSKDCKYIFEILCAAYPIPASKWLIDFVASNPPHKIKSEQITSGLNALTKANKCRLINDRGTSAWLPFHSEYIAFLEEEFLNKQNKRKKRKVKRGL